MTRRLEGSQVHYPPEACIDCAACEQACPVEAISAEDDVPEQWNEFVAITYALPDRAEAVNAMIARAVPTG